MLDGAKMLHLMTIWGHTEINSAQLLPPEWRLAQCLFG